MKEEKIVLDLCGGTGAWSQPYVDAGYSVHVLTLPHYDVKKVYWHDSRILFVGLNGAPDKSFDYREIYGVFAAPPCTMFSRARTTAKTPRDFKEAMETVRACLEIIWRIQFKSPYTLKFWAMENPAGHLQRFLGKPPFKFHPYDFGDPHSKQTFIWGNFNLPKKSPITLNEEQVRRSRNNTRKLPEIPEGYVRDPNMKPVQIKRSITPSGFAKAFFKANQ